MASFKQDWASAIEVESARPVIYTGTGLTAFLVLFRDGIVEPFQQQVADHQPLSEDLSSFGDFYVLFIAI